MEQTVEFRASRAPVLGTKIDTLGKGNGERGTGNGNPGYRDTAQLLGIDGEECNVARNTTYQRPQVGFRPCLYRVSAGVLRDTRRDGLS